MPSLKKKNKRRLRGNSQYGGDRVMRLSDVALGTNGIGAVHDKGQVAVITEPPPITHNVQTLTPTTTEATVGGRRKKRTLKRRRRFL